MQIDVDILISDEAVAHLQKNSYQAYSASLLKKHIECQHCFAKLFDGDEDYGKNFRRYRKGKKIKNFPHENNCILKIVETSNENN